MFCLLRSFFAKLRCVTADVAAELACDPHEADSELQAPIDRQFWLPVAAAVATLGVLVGLQPDLQLPNAHQEQMATITRLVITGFCSVSIVYHVSLWKLVYALPHGVLILYLLLRKPSHSKLVGLYLLICVLIFPSTLLLVEMNWIPAGSPWPALLGLPVASALLNVSLSKHLIGMLWKTAVVLAGGPTDAHRFISIAAALLSSLAFIAKMTWIHSLQGSNHQDHTNTTRWTRLEKELVLVSTCVIFSMALWVGRAINTDTHIIHPDSRLWLAIAAALMVSRLVLLHPTNYLSHQICQLPDLEQVSMDSEQLQDCRRGMAVLYQSLLLVVFAVSGFRLPAIADDLCAVVPFLLFLLVLYSYRHTLKANDIPWYVCCINWIYPAHCLLFYWEILPVAFPWQPAIIFPLLQLVLHDSILKHLQSVLVPTAIGMVSASTNMHRFQVLAAFLISCLLLILKLALISWNVKSQQVIILRAQYSAMNKVRLLIRIFSWLDCGCFGAVP